MNFTNDELHKLKQILNLFKKTNALDTLIQGSNITLSRNKCGQTVISSSGGGSNLPIEVENALLNANTPSSTNPYATLSDISTTANITDSIDKRFVTDANLIVIGNTSGVNTGDNAVNSLYSGLVSNATHTGEVTGSTTLTLDKTAITNKTTVTVANDDYVLISDTSDSGNLKKALKSDFGGSSSLSGLTAATATNTIDNLNFQQNWNFSTLDTTIGLKIATAAAQTTSATQVLVQFRKTNTTTGVKASAVLEVINEDANLSSTSIGARFEGRNYGVVIGGSSYQGNLGLIGSGALRFGLSSSNYNSYGAQILESGGDLTLIPKSTRRVSIWTGSLNTTDFLDSGGNPYCSLELDATNVNRIVLGGSRYGYRSTYGAAIQQTSGVLSLGAFLVSGGMKYQLSLSDASNNVGIGTTTPNASAKLDVSSTTQGVLLPRMTTTQKNAIASPAEGLEVYDSTLKKKCFYNGTAWETITSI